MKNKIKYLILPVLFLNLFFTFNFNVDAAMETNSDAGYDTTTISCGNVKGIPIGVAILSRNVVKTIKFLVPVILIVLGIVDMLRATTANDEKVMKEATGKFIRRIIAAVLVFFVISLLTFIINLIAKAARESRNSDELSTSSISECISCFISNKNMCESDNYFESD